jgi:hypothetical protein
VAVHEFAQHPTSGEVVAATHGRSLWVLDVTPLRQMTATALKAKSHLYQPNAVVKWRLEQGREGMFGGADRKFYGDNPPSGAQIYYSLTQKANKISLQVLDYTGKMMSELQASAEPGLHRATWNMSEGRQRGGMGGRGGFRGAQAGQARPGGARAAGSPRTATPAAPPAQTPGAPAAAPASQPEEPMELPAFFGGGAQQVKPGIYKVVLNVDGAEQTQWVRIDPDPSETSSLIATPIDEEP